MVWRLAGVESSRVANRKELISGDVLTKSQSRLVRISKSKACSSVFVLCLLLECRCYGVWYGMWYVTQSPGGVKGNLLYMYESKINFEA